MGVRKRRKYSREFKVEAVQQILVEDRTPKDVATELDMPVGLLRRWVRDFVEDEQEAFPGKAVASRRTWRSSS